MANFIGFPTQTHDKARQSLVRLARWLLFSTNADTVNKNSSPANPDLGGIACKTVRLVPDQRGLAEAGERLKEGQLVAFPTETVYGLGADATSPKAISALYAAKGRPQFNPLIAHVCHREQAEREGLFNEQARLLAERFWPGPLTLVLPRQPKGTVCDLACAGLESIGLRFPSHPIAQRVLEQAGRPISAPSANRSGHISPTEAAHVLTDLDGRIDAVVEAYASPVGVESTIIACLGSEPQLLRHGGVTIEEIFAKTGLRIAQQGHGKVIAPGMLDSHYAPQARVRLNALEAQPDEALLLFGAFEPQGLAEAGPRLNLSPRGDLTEAAANLYGYLRRLDRQATKAIAIAPIPESGLGAAINDRLLRAAAPRP